MLLNVELDVRGYQRIVFQGSDIIDGHYCQLCIPIYMQFPSLFTHCAVSNCKIDIIGYQMIAFKVYDNIFERHVFCNSIGAQNDRIDLVIAIKKMPMSVALFPQKHLRALPSVYRVIQHNRINSR